MSMTASPARFARICRPSGPRIVSIVGARAEVTPFGTLNQLIEHRATGRLPVSEEIDAGLLDDAIYLPILTPQTMLFCGVNYEEHLREGTRPRPKDPFFFAKLTSSLIGHGQPIRVRSTQSVDYEGELAVIIGTTARSLGADALEYVWGYTIVNDVSDRAVQFTDHQMTLGKGPDTFCPAGPAAVPIADLGDGSGLRLSTRVNGEVRQEASTSDMTCGVVELLQFVTRTITLFPGDVVSTGTPAGVGIHRDPPAMLQPGDEVTVEIEGIGRLTNPVSAEAS